MHVARPFPVHFALRPIRHDAPTAELLAPEWRHPDGTGRLWNLLYRCYGADRQPVYPAHEYMFMAANASKSP